MNDVDAIHTAQRLQTLGIVVKSPTLAATARDLNDFHARGGNRAMRRAAAKQARRTR